MYLQAGVRVAILVYDDVDFHTMPWAARLFAVRRVPRGVHKMRTCLVHVPEFRFFERVWLLDSDLRPRRVDDVRRVVASASLRGTAIASPVVVGSAHGFMQPAAGCLRRETDFVEIIAPLILTLHIDTLWSISPREGQTFWGVEWGMDVVWCKYLEHAHSVARPCAIVDAAHFVHRDVVSGGYNTSVPRQMERCYTRGYLAPYASAWAARCMRDARKRGVPKRVKKVKWFG